MSKITYENVIELAKSSRIAITTEEAQQFVQEIEAVLDYVSCLQEVARKYPDIVLERSQCNIMRSDTVALVDSRKLLQLAPSEENSYFVVPRIIKSDEE